MRNLTPAQFTVARALASAHDHLWPGVPDGTYSLEAIRDYSDRQQNDMSIGGIYYPYIDEEGNVVHTTGSGRLTWTITRSGNASFQVTRPLPLPYVEKNYGDYGDESCVVLCQIDVINEDENAFAWSSDTLIHMSGYAYETDLKIRLDQGFRTELIGERHVKAIQKGLVALMMVNEEAGYDEIRQECIARARNILAPLYELALPDSYNDERLGYTGIPEEEQRPRTYWSKNRETTPLLEVVHEGERFPVESECVAIHAVLLLQKYPMMSLIDAVKASVTAKTYRPFFE